MTTTRRCCCGCALAALRALAGGVTTIRDLGDRNYVSLTLRDWFRSGAEVGPEILASGPPITVTRGHCWFLGGEADGADGIRQAVHDRASRGVDVIKIMATGGNMTPTVGPHESQYTVDELLAAVDRGAHAPGCRSRLTLTAARASPMPWRPAWTASSTARSSPPTVSKLTLRSSPSSAVAGRLCRSPAAHFRDRHRPFPRSPSGWTRS